ncbi:MAG: flagellar hook-basal body complex protein [Lachnospiraceae bacterium]|nr:flagellar hook-basal body complex protein [Lachnospiraceae bacterium]
MGIELGTPDYFQTTASQDDINTALNQLKTSAIKPTVELDTDESSNNYTDYIVDLVGTKYYTQLRFNTDDGTFKSIGSADIATLAMKNLDGKFENIAIDFTQVTMFNNGGTSTMGITNGSIGSTAGAGKKLGAMTGVSINNNGMIYGSYDNGNTVLLGQIAVAKFANASGLEALGDGCYNTTLNSGEFDGIGMDISSDGGSLTTGALEMSNVDLSAEFTDMITTQRGFQANSRVITTSDTLLEELINLKR